MLKKNILFFFLILFLSNYHLVFSQSYEEIFSKYEKLEANNPKALPFIRQYINKAKKEKNYSQLIQGYLDEGVYNPDNTLKLKYADSAIISAKISGNASLIVKSYMMKGSLYYFYKRKYKLALSNYVKAYQYSKKADDNYYRHSIIYHIGVVKSYLGYYSEALNQFNECISYFEPFTKSKTLHPDLIYNNTKGYLNSLHQAIICYRNLGFYNKSDSLIKAGLRAAKNSKDYNLERAYFFKCRGILGYHYKNYNHTIADLNSALPEIIKNEDFAWVAASYFYKGKSYLALGNKKKAIDNFIKVDSIFKKEKFILPELRENFEILINDAKKRKDASKELYYTKNLLKADSIINKDFTYLSSRIHKEYDTQILLETKNNLERQKNWGYSIIVLLAILTLGLIFLLIKYYLKEKSIKQNYRDLETRLQNIKEQHKPSENNEETVKPFVNAAIYKDILQKLEDFEANKEFREKGLTLSKLAKSFDTNSTYLSMAINETKNMSFNKYLAELRIGYITQKLYYDKTLLKYTVDALAEECGIASRQNFSDLFQEINGIRPKDFIKQRKLELDSNKD